jgi:hypothetical protein
MLAIWIFGFCTVRLNRLGLRVDYVTFSCLTLRIAYGGAFLARRRGAELADRQEVEARDGELKEALMCSAAQLKGNRIFRCSAINRKNSFSNHRLACSHPEPLRILRPSFRP